MKREDAERLADELSLRALIDPGAFIDHSATATERAIRDRVRKLILEALERASIIKPTSVEAAEGLVIERARTLAETFWPRPGGHEGPPGTKDPIDALRDALQRYDVLMLRGDVERCTEIHVVDVHAARAFIPTLTDGAGVHPREVRCIGYAGHTGAMYAEDRVHRGPLGIWHWGTRETE